MLIGTAGHIDHGKTTLIRALTGVDTDRLPEEKRRGISIDLGFAYLPADRGVIGFIDVPGHERFVPAMLAGATGIDFALLVVAADDGPMPQTREHLDILHLLGLTRGAVALTKVDKATPEQRQQAEAALDALLADTPLAAAPRFAVDAPRGTGVAALRDYLRAQSALLRAEPNAPFFRLAIDRSFSLPGAGTVVTGTVHAGRVAVGDTLCVVRPTNGQPVEVRVRSLHANNRPAEEAVRGMRCALNLTGISHHETARGDWLVSPALAECDAGRRGNQGSPGTHIDIALQPLADAGSDARAALRPGVELHVHHGAGHVMGRLIALAPSEGLWQLVTRTPLSVCHGDPLILRDASGQRTLAGARVLDPAGPLRHRARPERLAQLAALRVPDVRERLAALLAATPLGVDRADFVRAANADPGDLALLPSVLALSLAGDAVRLFAAPHYTALAARVAGLLADYHARHPDELGLERERLRRISVPQIDGRTFLALLTRWKEAGELAQTGSAWHLPTHRVELSGAEQELAARVRPLLLDTPFDPPWVRDLAAQTGVEEAAMRQLLRKLAAQGDVFQVVRDLFYHRDAVRELSTLFYRLADLGDLGDLAGSAEAPTAAAQPVKAAAFRDRTGLGRKRAIQILEFFDRVGFTRRIGSGTAQAHVIRGDAPVT